MELAPDVLDLLTDYDWPGNVRELENVIERAVVLTSGSRIGVELIPDHVRKAPNFNIPQFVVPPEGISFKDVITDFEKKLIESTLEAAGGVQKRAAELLHIKPTTLNEMIKRYDIRPRRKRQPANGHDGGEHWRGTAPHRAADTAGAGRRAGRDSSLPGVADLGEDPLVLPQHDIPAVIAADVVAAVPAERRAQTRVGEQQLQALDELVAVGVIQAAVAVHAVLDEHGAARVDENRRAD